MTSSRVASVTASELRQMLTRANPPLLLDVREPDEWQFCRIEGAQLLPMSQIDQRVAELDPAHETVVYCHVGVRSQMVADFLIVKGFARVASLAGGIDAWSVFIDPTVKRY
jgi:sulfur-carrier protein adenylyltransferase/sulfurtransferase